MAAIIPCKQIGLEPYFRRKNSKGSRSAQPRGCHVPESDHHSGGTLPFQNLEVEPAIDDQLRRYETDARLKYFDITRTLSFDKLPGWLDRMLDQSFLPTLQRVGFDAPLARALFQMAPSAWKLMGPLDEKTIAFHPHCLNEGVFPASPNNQRQGSKEQRRKGFS